MHENHPHPRPNIITVRIPGQTADAISAVRQPNKTFMHMMTDAITAYTDIRINLPELRSESLADVLKSDYTTSLMEFSHGPIKTSMQMMTDAITAYTDITTRLPDVGIVSVVQQAFNIVDAVKPDYTEMFAHLSSLHIQPVQQILSSAIDITAHIKAFHWQSHIPYDELRRMCCVLILRKIDPDLEESYRAAHEVFSLRNRDYKRHTLISLRTIGENCMSIALQGYNSSQMIEFLREQNIKRSLYLRKGNISSRGKTIFLVRSKSCHSDHDNVITKIGDFFQNVNELHQRKISLSDYRIAELILALDYLIIEIFVDWCLPEEMALTA